MRHKKWGGFLLATIVAALVPAFANATTIDKQSTFLKDNLDGSVQLINVRREVTGAKNYVDAWFDYTITADDSNPAPVENLQEGGRVYVSGAPDETHMAFGMGSFIMGETKFSELGDYKFILREVASSDPDNYPVDDSHEYYIYISVRNETEAGVPTGRLLATLSRQVRDHDEGAKMDPVFSSEAVRTRLELSKNVIGNLADTEEYFKFLVSIDGREGDLYTISGQDESVNYGGETITTTSVFEVGENEVEVYLRHGQTVTIGLGSDGLNEIPINASYSIQELGAADYDTTVDGFDGKITTAKQSAMLLSNGALPNENKTAFVNRKESEVLTGVTLAIIPAAIIIVALFVGAVVVRKIKKDSSNKR